jgi:RIO kinase 1
MKIPARLEPLLDVGLIDDVIRPLMSGKEAAVYLVESRGELRVAKVYKDAQKRSFKHRTDYTEGRKVRNSRRQRAMEKRSKFGREEIEAAWRTAEVDAIRRLREADVRVPEPFEFYEGVLVMELIEGEPGLPAPRLIDVELKPSEARSLHRILLVEIVKMLCAGVVHGDLSDFNVLLREDGPVIIDFPQAVDPSFNNNAKKLFIRDVDNISSFLARFAPELGRKRYGKEIWQLYERGELDPEIELTGSFTESNRVANVGAILDEIDAARDEAMRMRGERPEREERSSDRYSDRDDDWNSDRNGDWNSDRNGDWNSDRNGDWKSDRNPDRSSDRPRGRRGEPPPSAVEMAAEGAPRRRAVFVPSPPANNRGPKKSRRRRGPPRDDHGRNGSDRRSDGGRPDYPSGRDFRPETGGSADSDHRGSRGNRRQGGPRESSDGWNHAPPPRSESQRPPRSSNAAPNGPSGDAPKKRRRRRRRRGGGSGTPSGEQSG